MLAVLLAIHVLAVTLWVGGMFFAHFMLRPSVMDPALNLGLESRVLLWSQVLQRFVRVVWVIVLLLPVTGYTMIIFYLGGLSAQPLHVHLMQGTAWIMIALFVHLYTGPFRRMQWMVKQLLIPEAGLYLGRIRTVVTVNMTIGMVTVVLATAGRYWL
ncbi:MAG: CopD family protein [Magnetococcales bacterium]|nr:CopD family protein [Magnetococcales bacterium]